MRRTSPRQAGETTVGSVNSSPSEPESAPDTGSVQTSGVLSSRRLRNDLRRMPVRSASSTGRVVIENASAEATSLAGSHEHADWADGASSDSQRPSRHRHHGPWALDLAQSLPGSTLGTASDFRGTLLCKLSGGLSAP